MAALTGKRKGFFLVEALAVCIISGIFLTAVFSTLYISGVLFNRQREMLGKERLKREVLAELTALEELKDGT